MNNFFKHILLIFGFRVEVVYTRYSEIYLEFILDEKTISCIEILVETIH